MFYSFPNDLMKNTKVLVFRYAAIASRQISKRGSPWAARNSALNTPYPPLPYIIWTLWTWGFNRYHQMYTIPYLEQIAMKRPAFGLFLVISEVGSQDYVAKSAILKIWVFWVMSMHYITLCVIYIHTTLKFGGFWDWTGSISWCQVFNTR